MFLPIPLRAGVRRAAASLMAVMFVAAQPHAALASSLRQVTVRRVDQALTSTPAALLAGNNEAMRAFRMSDQGEQDGLEWLEAVPREKEGGFERVRMGFGSGGLEAMEFYDSFGQITLLRFISLTRNPGLDPATFQFSPPEGVDVIGD